MVDVPKREALEIVGVAIVTAAGAVAKTHPYLQAYPELGAFIDVVGSAVGMSLGRQADYVLSQRMPRWTKGLSDASGGDPKKFEAHAKEQSENPGHHEVMYRSFKQMTEAADDSVIEALGYMAARYTYGNKKADAFFRGLGKVLCDLEAGEFEELKTLLRTIEALNRDEKLEWLDVAHEWREKEDNVYEPIVELVLASSTGSHGPGVDSAPRFFMLLKRETLARNKSSRYEADRNFESGDQAMYISADTLQEILDVIDPLGEAKVEVA
jgi:hypothetical protein